MRKNEGKGVFHVLSMLSIQPDHPISLVSFLYTLPMSSYIKIDNSQSSTVSVTNMLNMGKQLAWQHCGSKYTARHPVLLNGNKFLCQSFSECGNLLSLRIVHAS